MTSAAKQPCKNKAVEGLEVDGKCVCKNHYANYMLTIKLKEIAAAKPPVVEEKVELIPCISKTKDGKACRHHSVKDCDGLCKIHFEAAKRAAAPPTPPKEKPKCVSQTKDNKPCGNYQKDGCDSMCQRCFTRIKREQDATAAKEAKKNKSKATSNVSVQSDIEKAKHILLGSIPPMTFPSSNEEEGEEETVIPSVNLNLPSGF
jgi:hypothetical protein